MTTHSVHTLLFLVLFCGASAVNALENVSESGPDSSEQEVSVNKYYEEALYRLRHKQQIGIKETEARLLTSERRFLQSMIQSDDQVLKRRYIMFVMTRQLLSAEDALRQEKIQGKYVNIIAYLESHIDALKADLRVLESFER